MHVGSVDDEGAALGLNDCNLKEYIHALGIKYRWWMGWYCFIDWSAVDNDTAAGM